jgi:hypothetical protein
MDQPIWVNYIKPRTSNITNKNASIVTVKAQAKTIFTGYTRQINSINKGVKTTLYPNIFNGDDGSAVSNLKNGNTWTDPATLNSIQYLS